MTVNASLFKTPTIDDTANELADHMPQGKLWEGKYVDGSNLRSLVYGMARPFNFVEAKIEELSIDFDIRQTTQLIEEWETSVGLPDPCIGALTDLNERRQLVEEIFTKRPSVTLAEHQALVDRNFYPPDRIVLVPGMEFFGQGFEYRWPIFFTGGTTINMRFILVALFVNQGQGFEYQLEMPFLGAPDTSRLRCFLERVIPANVYLLIQQVSEPDLIYWKGLMQAEYNVIYSW